MMIIGVTGQIGMGKSVVSSMFKRLGFWVYDADREARQLLDDDDVISKIRAIFGKGCLLPSGCVNRDYLRRCVLGSEENLRQLERLIHPRLSSLLVSFLRKAWINRCRGVVLDVPLLFEKGGWRRCDHVVVVSAPFFVQRARLRRRGLSWGDMERFMALQWSDRQKCRAADYIIKTGLGYDHAWRSVVWYVRHGLCGGSRKPLRAYLDGERRLKRERLYA
ncbi:MAG: dephospho-CoA kinase [Alphaproteobacteria bacterium GM7ARS4]|nr:dephospho-CoA kinase [Alphaproteobacteria bacterium GM7ARS4]